ncbi:VOC family protein [Solimonas marina]|uniref:Glyoxalase n=1 Tax=Solimonas marina TaxID=2714601 RepID=A0A969WAS1_9GAMM|nr:VOC family protein [Solimonas marina]NKF23532.1 glyoxalase [Solimonas marina]
MTQLTTAQPARHPAPTAKATALLYLIFERPDPERAEKFLTDFGLLPVEHRDDVRYLRGTAGIPYCYRIERGRSARFVGAGFSVASKAELEALARLPGAGPIKTVDAPGGGAAVTLTDPAGFRIEIVHGQQTVASLPHRPPMTFNTPDEDVRVNGTQRPPANPPEVIRLGHMVLEVANYQQTCAWYTQHLGLIPSDVQVLDDGSPAVTFLRLDLGDTPADHHTVALAQGFMATYSHSAYEVVDVDAVSMGQRVLRERGWTHAWGMGRHILGSQIFDYWQDPWGDKHEHYCDGDKFTAERPTGIHEVSREAMSQWGPIMPKSFTKPRMTPAAVTALVRNLRSTPDLSLKKLATLARLFS